jgi:hypothetical protein
MRSIQQAVNELQASQTREPATGSEVPAIVTTPHSRYHISTRKKDYVDIVLHQNVENSDFATVVSFNTAYQYYAPDSRCVGLHTQIERPPSVSYQWLPARSNTARVF